MFARLFPVLLLLSLVVAGCERTAEKQGEVSGKVTYHGKPLPGGRIQFVGAKGYNIIGIISPQGEYSVKPPLGEVQISVDNSALKEDPEWTKHSKGGMKNKLKKPADMSGEGEGSQTKSDQASVGKQVTQHGVSGTYVKIPGRYADPALSGLKMTVTEGPQTHDIELTDAPEPTPGS